jgi:hypothetical protein
MSSVGQVLFNTGPGGVPTYQEMFPWNECTYLKQTLSSKNGYFSDAPGLCLMSLPVSSIVGDTIKIICKGENGVQVAQNAGQQIILNAKSMTTIGVLGFVTSTEQYDVVTLTCITGGTSSVWFAETTGKWKVS